MRTTADKITVTCACGAEAAAKLAKDGTPKVPRSRNGAWKRVGDQLLCPVCQAKSYYVRAVRVQIIGVDGGDVEANKSMWRTLNAAGAESARLANWYVRELLKCDAIVEPLPRTKDGKAKIPTCPNDYLYPEAARLFPLLAGTTITALLKMIRGWYGTRRFEALVRCNRSVDSYRFGYLPIEVPAQNWSVRTNADGKYVVRANVSSGGAHTFSISCDVRAMTAIRQLAAGDAQPLGLKVVRRSRRTKNGELVKSWFFRLALMLPRKVQRQSHQEIALTLVHDAGALLVGTLEADDSDVFEFPGTELRRLIFAGDRADRRRQQEQSMARGILSGRVRERMAERRSDAALLRRQRVAAQLKFAAAALARWCVSHGVTSVDYDRTDRGFLPHCPWRALSDGIKNALEAQGIGVHELGALPVSSDTGLEAQDA